MLHPPPIAHALASGCPGPAAITLGLPLLAWGFLAIAAPILVHLVFRERAHRQVFPAMRFLLQSHLAATRAQWLRHLLLLLARVAVIVLAVGLLGRIGCTGQGSAPAMLASAGPASVVICVDNSASMGYRFQGRTRIQAAVEWASNLAQDRSRFGPGSQFAVVCGTPAAGMGGWREDVAVTARLLDTIRPAAHNLGVANLLSQAGPLIPAARHPRREIYLFTDLTETSWSETPAPLPSSVTGLFVMDVGQAENRNVMLGWPQVPSHPVTAGAPAAIPVRVVGGDLPSEPLIQFTLDGKPRGTQPVGPLAPNSQTEVLLAVPPLDAGPHALTIDMEPGDALACDNTRFAWLMVGSLPRVGLLQADAGNEVAGLAAAMIAPPALPVAEHRYRLNRVALDRLLETELQEMVALLVVDVKGLNGLAWEKLAAYVQRGGTLMIVPGPAIDPAGYAAGQAILPGVIEGITDCTPPLRPAASDLSQAYLQPFAEAGIDSINDRQAFKRLRVRPVAGQSTVIFPFADGSPACVERQVGKGRAILLAFSPHPEWGQFGTQAAPLIVLLHQILEVARPPLGNLAALTAGRPVQRSVDLGGSPLLIRSADGTDQSVLPTPGRTYALPADRPQTYEAADKSLPTRVGLYYSVNVAETESHPRRIDSDTIKSRMESCPTVVLGPRDPWLTPGDSPQAGIRWHTPLGLLMILLLVAETSFANRFYRSFRPGLP
jgi:hypothetical protein